MKKLLALVLSITLAAVAFTGCGSDKNDSNETTSAETTVSESVENPGATDGAVKTGLAVISSSTGSKEAGEEDGKAAMDSTVVAVTVDADGKIVDCVIDVLQTRIGFTAEGKLTTPADTEFKTKLELGDDYGMKPSSAIGKEWYEQIAVFCDYVKGKTAEEVQGTELEEDNYFVDEDLAATCSIKVSSYINGVVKAVANAKDMGASASDKLSLGITSNMGYSKDAEADADGLAQASTTYAVLTTDASGKITSSIVEASQTNVNFDATGKITSELAADNKSKTELGEDYGMRSASAIGKEWFEQAEGFASYITGKTISDVEGIAVEDGYADDEDLSATCSINIGEFMTAVEKAAK